MKKFQKGIVSSVLGGHVLTLLYLLICHRGHALCYSVLFCSLHSLFSYTIVILSLSPFLGHTKPRGISGEVSRKNTIFYHFLSVPSSFQNRYTIPCLCPSRTNELAQDEKIQFQTPCCELHSTLFTTPSQTSIHPSMITCSSPLLPAFTLSCISEATVNPPPIPNHIRNPPPLSTHKLIPPLNQMPWTSTRPRTSTLHFPRLPHPLRHTPHHRIPPAFLPPSYFHSHLMHKHPIEPVPETIRFELPVANDCEMARGLVVDGVVSFEGWGYVSGVGRRDGVVGAFGAEVGLVEVGVAPGEGAGKVGGWSCFFWWLLVGGQGALQLEEEAFFWEWVLVGECWWRLRPMVALDLMIVLGMQAGRRRRGRLCGDCCKGPRRRRCRRSDGF